jgi:hypothetical protein
MKRRMGRKAVILLTDGVDHGSKESLAQAIESAQRTDTLVYSILFSGEEQQQRGGGGFGGRGYGRRGWRTKSGGIRKRRRKEGAATDVARNRRRLL